jgi:D-galactarolactone cycloisomerase
MKIVNIESYLLSDQLREAFYFSQWSYSERRICIVKITTDEGIIGWGEGYGPADVLEAGIKLLKPLLIGKDPLSQEALWFEMYRKTLDYARRGILVASISSLDIALWDIKGKALNLPVSTLLGGCHRTRIMPYATGLYFSESDDLSACLAKEAKDYVSQGFHAIKMKVGLTLKADVENVAAVRKAIGPDIKLMVDANHAYSLREAVELARKIEQYDIGWFEEPVSPEFYDHYKTLRDKTTIPIAGGECEYLRYGHHQLLKSDSVDILQVDICSAGGLTEAKRIAALASTYGIEIIPHTWGTGIAFHAALHFIANLEPLPGRLYPPDFYIEYDRTSNGIRERLTEPAIEMKDGYIDVPTKPGLGIEVNEEALAYFTRNSKNGVKIT